MVIWRFDEGNILAVYAFRGLCSCVALQDFYSPAMLQCRWRNGPAKKWQI